ncbi:hypothetical protein WDZ92_53680, partial [Nostoc sp. NIES-2111]
PPGLPRTGGGAEAFEQAQARRRRAIAAARLAGRAGGRLVPRVLRRRGREQREAVLERVHRRRVQRDGSEGRNGTEGVSFHSATGKTYP